MGISRATFLACILGAVAFLALLSSGLATFSGPPPPDAPEPFTRVVADAIESWFGEPEPEVIAFTSSGDPASRELMLRLRRAGIPFTERVVDADPAARADLARLTPHGYVPTLVINELAMRGDDHTQLEFSIATYQHRQRR